MAKSEKNNDSVTRISASSSAKSKKRKTTPVAVEKTQKSNVKKQPKEKSSRANPVSAFFGYFKGAWKELRQVRWPNRSATWSLTGAVLAFSAFFVVFILLLDALFKYIFEIILK